MPDPAPLSQIFLARRGERGPISAALAEPLEATLERLCSEARAAWPDLKLEAGAFVLALADRAAPAEDKGAWLQRLHAADLFVACAAATGVPGALAALERHYFPALDRALAALDRSASFADEVRQELRERLFVSRGGKAPRISTYTGDGALAAWLRVAALRAGGRLRQGHEKDVELDEEALRRIPGAGEDPEVRYLKDTYRREFREAFQAALVTLTPRERNLLRLQAVDELKGEQMAAIYRVNAGTISRWLARARATLLAETQRLLRERLKLSRSQLASLSGLVISQLDLSLPRLLKKQD